MDIRVGGTASNIGRWTEIPPVAVGNGWYRVGQYRDGTVTEDKTDSIFTSFYTPSAESGIPITIDWASPHLLANTTVIPPYDYSTSKVQDSSGYGYDGTVVGTPTLNNNSARYSISTYLDTGVNTRIVTPILNFDPRAVTLSIWFRSTNTSPTGGYHMVVDSNANR